VVLSRDYLSFDASREPQAAARFEREVVPEREPLELECAHFLAACSARSRPRTDGREGLRVLQVLDMAQRSLELDGEKVLAPATADHGPGPATIHPSAVVDPGAVIGAGSKIWHFCHVMAGARLGERVSLGQNVFVAASVVVGSDVKVQNNVSLYDGVELEDDVFVGPSCVFTNVKHPRAEVSRKHAYAKTLVRRGASLGANATVVPGVTLGRYCSIGAGAVVTRDVPDHALMVGCPARRVGWVGRRGVRLTPHTGGDLICPESGERYREQGEALVSLDLAGGG
jgi:UDP-2-acetamido-3-amino-2,3-dideoxy-glucuronate N-acetyltransferase